MSVVNKMLQDLEKRQQDESKVEQDYQPVKRDRRPVLLVTLAVVLILALFGTWNWFQPAAGKADVSMAETQPVQAAKVNNTNKVSAETATAQPPKTQQNTSEPSVTPVTKPDTPGSERQVSESSRRPATGDETEASPSSPVTTAKTNKPSTVSTGKVEAARPQTGNATQRAKTGGEAAQDDNTENADTAPRQMQKHRVQLSESEQLARQLEQLLADNRYGQAVTVLTRMIELKPGDHALRAKLVTLSLQTGQPGKAIDSLRQAIAQFPRHYEYRRQLARLWQARQPEQALSLLMGVSPPVKAVPSYYVLRAQIARKLERHRQAAADYTRLLEIEPRNSRWRLSLAIALDKSGQRQLASRHYRQVLSYPDLPEQARQFIQQRLNTLGGTDA